VPPSADGASPTAVNIAADNGAVAAAGADVTSGSATVAVLTGAGATSTDALVGVLSVAGAALGCDVVAVADWPPELSAPDGVLTTGRFGFFGAIAAVDVSEPDFLGLITGVVVDFLPPPVLPVPLDVSLPAELPLPLLLAPAPSPAGVDWDDGDCVSELEKDEDEEDVSVDELVDPESVGPAHATPGVVATATPTPKATAKPPTRPTYVAYPITAPSQYGRERQLALQEHRQL
jgi:hypothetical protein